MREILMYVNKKELTAQVISYITYCVDKNGFLSATIRKKEELTLGYCIDVRLSFFYSYDYKSGYKSLKFDEYLLIDGIKVKSKKPVFPRKRIIITSMKVIEKILISLLPHLTKQREEVLKMLELIDVVKKSKETVPQDMSLFLQACRLVDLNFSKYHLGIKAHNEKTVSQHFKSKFSFDESNNKNS